MEKDYNYNLNEQINWIDLAMGNASTNWGKDKGSITIYNWDISAMKAIYESLNRLKDLEK